MLKDCAILLLMFSKTTTKKNKQQTLENKKAKIQIMRNIIIVVIQGNTPTKARYDETLCVCVDMKLTIMIVID